MPINRRSLLGLFGAAATLPRAAGARPAPAGVTFAHGIASGDPTSIGAVLWTRVSPPAGHQAPIAVAWRVLEGRKVIEKGQTEARASRDWMVKVEARKLKPGRAYRYRFEAAGVKSPEGQVRTLPNGKTADVVLAVASCALHPGGLFNAYRAIADLPRVDAVVHLGDYLYEYGPEGYGAATGKRLGRIPEPPREMTTLADYRLRHAQYERDPDLQAAHARAAMPDVPIGAMIAAMNEEVLFCDQRAKGYVLLTLTREHARAEFRAVSTVMAKPFTVATIAMYEVRARDATVALRRV